MAIGSNNKIKIELELDAKGSVKSVQQLNDEFNKLESKGKASVEGISSSFKILGGIIAGIAIKKLASEIGSLAQQGAQLQGLTNAFNDLQISAGALGSQSLNDLRKATSGLVSDLEIMQSANNAVLLGLPTEGFDKLAESATKLGIATGRTATEALNDLVVGVGRGSKLILDNLGILVDTTQAYEKYAESINTTVNALDEEQKKLAFQAEAYDQIKNKSGELENVQIGAGNAVTQLSVAFQNLVGDIAKNLNKNDELQKSLTEIAIKLSEIDTRALIEGLGTLASAFVDLANTALSAINYISEGWHEILSLFPAIRQELKLDAFNEQTLIATQQTRAFAISLLELKQADALRELEPKITSVKNQFKEAKQAFEEASKPIALLRKEIEALEARKNPFLEGKTVALKGKLDELQESLIPLGSRVATTSKQLDILKKAKEDILKPTEKITKATKEETKVQDDYSKALDRLKDTLKVITGSTGTEKYIDLVEDLTRKKKSGVISNNEYSEALLKIAKDANFSAEQLLIFTDRIKGIDQEVRKTKTGLENIFGQDSALTVGLKGTTFENLTNGIFGGNFGEQFGQQIVGDMINGLSQAFSALSSGGSLDPAIQEMGGSIGSAIGGALAGTAGAQFGEKFGKKVGTSLGKIGESTGGTVRGIASILSGGLTDALGLGPGIENMFSGNKNAEANARVGFEKFIREVLDEKELQLVIDGQLQKLDFGIKGGRGAFDGGGLFDTAFEGLDADVVAGFSGIGIAMQNLLGLGEDVGSQLGAILSDNLGGSLNNLQILINRLGVSAEDMSQAVKDAWLTGDISANEALVTLQKIQQVTTQGIPDGLGFTAQAFDNLIKSAGSGEIVLDALGDLAVEAGEKGIGSLEALRQDLLASGADASKIASLFDAIANAGITSLDALKNVSVDSALAISSALESTPDFFADKIASLDEIQGRLDRIENKEVDIKFNFKSTIDENTNKAMQAGAFNSSGTETVGAEGTL